MSMLGMVHLIGNKEHTILACIHLQTNTLLVLIEQYLNLFKYKRHKYYGKTCFIAILFRLNTNFGHGLQYRRIGRQTDRQTDRQEDRMEYSGQPIRSLKEVPKTLKSLYDTHRKLVVKF